MTTMNIPPALTLDATDMPWAHGILAPGFSLQLLAADVENGFVVFNGRFQPGTVLPTHQHTGAVHGFTSAGRWFYQEYGDASMNVAGSYIFEPAGSVHTLETPADNTEITKATFVLYGALILIDGDGACTGIVDPTTTLAMYYNTLEQQGDRRPNLIRGGTADIR
ncbi:hypothetical protein GII33_10280 [Gordonia pseudamarae]|uniref:ChrR-like cupin domain-containing protein n=1 Tax=Gordonia pseudamarae TaxID=2831662 RepID=A0ABX6IH24_9ACTN|nr:MULTISPECIES: 2,4'-dihydroxyacetophenone dioxygenase family protein [Gordonia]MBD0022531.1 2,4'-dihydroxyacetophenone dioxygenase family protein [Gordonia sp. (in: high G+C Gram-positive bacteria)]QHN26286.1 hypothetical protein GII33_10280 [Gordonia pseudamarae]QHN35178.1 hypothetical protein GII31_10080 [Gordonia pseudamarae]